MATCDLCGKEFDPKVSHYSHYCSDECFKRDFWLGKVENVKRGSCVVIDGRCYYLGREDSIGDRGYGGSLHYIKCDDGRLIKTTNLWYNGEIPEDMRSLLPDNAQFISQDSYEELVKEI